MFDKAMQTMRVVSLTILVLAFLLIFDGVLRMDFAGLANADTQLEVHGDELLEQVVW